MGLVAAARGLKGCESTLVRLILQRRLAFRLVLQPLLQLSDSWAIEARFWQSTALQSTAVKAGAVAVVALADDLPLARRWHRGGSEEARGSAWAEQSER